MEFGESKERLFSMARAKLMWGKPVDSIIKSLESEQLDPFEIREFVGEVMQERAVIIKSAGRRYLLRGSGMFFGSTISHHLRDFTNIS